MSRKFFVGWHARSSAFSSGLPRGATSARSWSVSMSVMYGRSAGCSGMSGDQIDSDSDVQPFSSTCTEPHNRTRRYTSASCAHSGDVSSSTSDRSRMVGRVLLCAARNASRTRRMYRTSRDTHPVRRSSCCSAAPMDLETCCSALTVPFRVPNVLSSPRFSANATVMASASCSCCCCCCCVCCVCCCCCGGGVRGDR